MQPDHQRNEIVTLGLAARDERTQIAGIVHDIGVGQQKVIWPH